MLMELRAALREGTVKPPEAVEDPKMLAVADLPHYIRRGLEALNLNMQHLFTARRTRRIINQIQSGQVVAGVSGNRRDFSSVTGTMNAQGQWENFPPEEIQERKLQLAKEKGWVPQNATTLSVEANDKVDVYNQSQQQGADAAFAFGDAWRRIRGIVASGGAFGTDISAVRGAVGAYSKVKGGTALVMMPDGIQKRKSPHNNRVQYNPNVPELDYEAKNIGAVSMYPETYDANERVSAAGNPVFTKHLMDRNGLVASFGHVLFITHAAEAPTDTSTGGTVDTALKALQIGRPVVILDPALFDAPMEGSEYLATLPGVYVIKESDDFGLYHRTEEQDERTGEMRTRHGWDGRNIALAVKMVADMHFPTAEFASNRTAQYSTYTQDWTENQIKDRIRELHDQAAVATAPFERLRIEYEVKELNRIRAERHPSPSRTSPVDFEYITQLDPTERQVSGGLIGLRNYDSFDAFYAALEASGAKVFVDVRQNTYNKVRDPQTGAMVDDWTHGTALREAFADKEIAYVPAPQFTPSNAQRQYQSVVDELVSISKMHRGALDAGFTTSYHNFLKETKADLGMFFKDTIAMHVGYRNTEGSAICFGCVEHESQACHRSMLGEIMSEVLGIEVLDVHEGGLTTPYEPHDHVDDTADLPAYAYSGKASVAVTPASRPYMPSRTSALQLVDVRTDTQGNVNFVAYQAS